MPDWKAEIRTRLSTSGVSTDSTHDAAILQEIADHLQDRYEAQRAAGASEREAIEAALDDLGAREPLAAAWREAHQPDRPEPVPVGARSSGHLLSDLWRDLRYGGRMLRKHPGFTAIAVLTLAVGIGANTTVFTVINTILLNPLPFARVSELVSVQTVERGDRGRSSSAGQSSAGQAPAGQGESRAGGGSGGASDLPLSYLNLIDLQARNDVFSSLAGYSSPLPLTVLNGNAPGRIFGELVTDRYFETLGLRPVIGRFFLPEEHRTPGTHPVVVLGYGTWQQRFAGAPDVIGQTIRLNRVPFTIVGVAPEGFKGVTAFFGPELWIPAMMTEQVVSAQLRTWLRDRGALGFRATGRLRPGVTIAQADASLQAAAAALAREYPEANEGRSLTAQPLTRANVLGSNRQGMTFGSVVLMAIVGLILLIACSNVANLLLARGAARRQEIALRLALGAGRARVVRQLLTESVLLGLVSGILGIALAWAGSRLLWSFRPQDVAQNFVDPALDLQVLLFGVIVSALTGLIFGAVPAWQSSHAPLVETLKEEARTAGRSRRRVGLNQALLVGQVALSLVSLVTAGLCLRAMQRAYATDPGFETERLGIVLVNPGQAGYDQPRTEQYLRDARTRIASIPGVTSVSWASNLPLFARRPQPIIVPGHERGDARGRGDAAGTLTITNSVDLDYFATMAIPLVRGRVFTDGDREDTLPVVVINETMAARYWPKEDAIGKRVRLASDAPTAFRQVVGVVRTANYVDLGEAPQACVYMPLRQNFADSLVLYVRTATPDPAPVLSTVQRELRTLDDQIDVADVRTIQKVIGQALFGATIGVGLLGVFGLIGLGLASLGLYGVMAYSVNLRHREIGVRMALGAGRASVLTLVLREGLTLVGAGILVGLGASLLVGRALSRLLFGVTAFDPLSFATAALVLMAAAALACYLPARRASRLDPLVALREG